MPRIAKLLVAVAALAVALVVFTAVNGRPGEQAAGAARGRAVVVLPGASTDARIAALQSNLRARVGRGGQLTALGDAYLQKVRETGDYAYYSRAQQAYGQALARDGRDIAATIGQGTLALGRHDFRAGLVAGRRARALAPEAAGPLPVVVDALVELGRYDEAGRVLQRLVDIKPGLSAYARVSYLRELRGDIRGAVSAMRLAVDAGSSTPEGTAYVQVLLGTLERNRGRLAVAGAAYRAALRAQPRFPAADAGLARVEAARGALGPAIRRLRSVVERLPLPEYIVALGETELAAGRTRAARDDLALVPAERRLLGASGVNTDGEFALFEADHGDPATGVRVAERAWRAAPSVRSADALGWALTRAGRRDEGYRWMRRAIGLGWREPLVLYHAAMSARAAGDRAATRRLLRRLLEQSPAFSPLYAPRARRALEHLP